MRTLERSTRTLESQNTAACLRGPFETERWFDDFLRRSVARLKIVVRTAHPFRYRAEANHSSWAFLTIWGWLWRLRFAYLAPNRRYSL